MHRLRARKRAALRYLSQRATRWKIKPLLVATANKPSTTTTNKHLPVVAMHVHRTGSL